MNMYTNPYMNMQNTSFPQAVPNYLQSQQNNVRTPYSGYYDNQYIIKGRPVSSIDEVKAITVDFDGTVFYFPDLVNNKIYTKSINPINGMPQLNTYVLKEIPKENIAEQQEQKNYVTREEFDAVIAELRSSSIVSKPIEQAKEQKQSIDPKVVSNF